MDSSRSPLAPLSLNGPSLPALMLAEALGGKVTQSVIGHKRSYSAINLDSDDEPITDSCDTVRRKINAFINSGEMKVTEFQRTIGVNSNSYGRFMKLKGPMSGNGNQVYEAAFRFFEDRRKAGIKPQKKKVKKDEEVKKFDVSGVELPGEEDGDIDVWETCDEMRKKINAFLREPDVTQAAFLREVAKMHPDGKAIQSKQLKDFLSKKGPTAGNTSKVFYCSYVFFEKMRIKHGKPKTAMREGTEAAWCMEGGIDTKRKLDGLYICYKDSYPVEDKYGKATIMRR